MTPPANHGSHVLVAVAAAVVVVVVVVVDSASRVLTRGRVIFKFSPCGFSWLALVEIELVGRPDLGRSYFRGTILP